MRLLSSQRFESCVVSGENVLGTHGEGLCVLCVRTGKLVARGPDGVAASVVTSLQLAGETVVATSADGTLSEWSATGEAAERSIVTEKKVLIVGGCTQGVYVVQQKEAVKGVAPTFELGCYSKGKNLRILDSKLPKGSERPAKEGLGVVLLNGKEQVVAFCGRYQLQLYHLSGEEVVAKVRGSSLENPFTAMALTGDALVTGHRAGQISVYRSALQLDSSVWLEARKNKKAFGDLGVTTSLHWHAHPVTALAISSCGSACLSGGEEAVLVVWPLRANSNSRDFLPRLGAPIVALRSMPAPRGTPKCSTGAALVLVVTADSAVHLAVLEGLKRLWSLFGLSSGYRRPANLTFAVTNNKLAVNFKPGTLQLVDVESDVVSDQIQVVPHNHISATAQGLTTRSPLVTRAAFSPDAQRLVSVDKWMINSEEEEVEEHLKFWSRVQGGWRVQATVSEAHGQSKSVKAIAFHPTLQVVATSADDGSVKIWSCLESSSREEAEHWRCTVVLPGSMNSAEALDFSSDGSLIAVAHARGPVLALWNVATGKKLASLTRPAACTKPSFVQVGLFDDSGLWPSGHPCGAIAHCKGLDVWDLATCKLAWSYSTPSESSSVLAAAIAPNHRNGDDDKVATLAVAIRRRGSSRSASSVLLFSHRRPEPLACVDLEDGPRSLVFVASRLIAEMREGALLDLLSEEAVVAEPLSRKKRKINNGTEVFIDGDVAVSPSSVFDFGPLLSHAPAWDPEYAKLTSAEAIFDAYCIDVVREPAGCD